MLGYSLKREMKQVAAASLLYLGGLAMGLSTVIDNRSEPARQSNTAKTMQVLRERGTRTAWDQGQIYSKVVEYKGKKYHVQYNDWHADGVGGNDSLIIVEGTLLAPAGSARQYTDWFSQSNSILSRQGIDSKYFFGLYSQLGVLIASGKDGEIKNLDSVVRRAIQQEPRRVSSIDFIDS